MRIHSTRFWSVLARYRHRPGTANTLVSVRGCCHQRALGRCHRKVKRVVAIGLEAKQMWAPDAGQHRGHPPPQRRCDLGLRRHREDADYFIRRVHQQMMLSLPRPA